MTDINANDMKPQDDPDKATRDLQLREMIRGLNYFYDWLDTGMSIEELMIRYDIIGAGAGWSKSHHKFGGKVLK